MAKAVYYLLKKDFLMEWRMRHNLNGIFLYIICTVFVCYLSVGLKTAKISPLTWNALLWIILLFASVNAVAKSFLQEKKGRLLYYYTLCSPQAIFLSKIIYNTLLLLLLSLFAYFFYSIVLGNPVQNKGMFLLTIILGAIGFSVTFTMISSIASKAENSGTLMTILSFPIIIPLLLHLMRLSKHAIDGLAFSVSASSLIILIALNCMMTALAYILFPYIWRN